MASIIKKNGQFHVQFKDLNGKKRTRSTGLPISNNNLLKAKKILRESKVEDIEAAAKSKILTNDIIQAILASDQITTAEAFGEWDDWAKINLADSTIELYRYNIKTFIAQSGTADIMVGDITESHIDEFVNEKVPIKWNSRRIRMAAVTNFIEMIVGRRYRYDNPLQRIKLKHQKLNHEQKESMVREPFTEEEYRTLRDHTRREYEEARLEFETENAVKGSGAYKKLRKDMQIKHFWYFAVEVGWHFGLRISDVALFEKGMLKPGLVIIHTIKSHQRIALPLEKLSTSDLMRMFRTLEIEDNQNYLFPEIAKLQLESNRRSYLPLMFGRILKTLDMKNGNKTFHSFRYTFVHRWKERGATYETIAKDIGHSDPSTTRIYGRNK